MTAFLKHGSPRSYMACSWANWALLLLLPWVTGGCRWFSFGKEDSFGPLQGTMTGPLVETIQETLGPDAAVRMLGPARTPEGLSADSGTFILGDQLNLAEFVDEVARRHPTVDAAESTWRAIQEIHPQVTAWDDTQFRFLNGPTLFGANNGAHLWRMQAQQPIPGWGKKGWRGRVAEEQASAAQDNLAATRNRIRLAASQVYFDYALVEAISPLIEAQHRITQDAIAAKRVQLMSGGNEILGQEELLEVEQLESDSLLEELTWNRQEAARRVNLILGRQAYEPLPPARVPAVNVRSWEPDDLFATLAARDPRLAQAEARCREAEARVELARCGIYPDFVLVARFDTNADSFWLPERAFIRPQIGLNALVPLHKQKTNAMVREAEAYFRQRRAERQAIEDELRQESAALVAEYQRQHGNLQRLERMAALAGQRMAALERNDGVQLVSWTDLCDARRLWLKYEVERTKAEFAWRQTAAQLEDANLAESFEISDLDGESMTPAELPANQDLRLSTPAESFDGLMPLPEVDLMDM